MSVCVDDGWEEKEMGISVANSTKKKSIWLIQPFVTASRSGLQAKMNTSNSQAFQSKADLFDESLAATEVTDETQNSVKQSPRGVTTCEETPKDVSEGIVGSQGKTYWHESRRKHRAWRIRADLYSDRV